MRGCQSLDEEENHGYLPFEAGFLLGFMLGQRLRKGNTLEAKEANTFNKVEKG